MFKTSVIGLISVFSKNYVQGIYNFLKFNNDFGDFF